jgi:CheY-like chemotaxis protein
MTSISEYSTFYRTLLPTAGFPASIPAILYVEEDHHLLYVVENVLEMAGCYVETCSDVGLALGLMSIRTHYSLLLLNNELRCLSGLELVRRARNIKHLKETPIILTSLEDHAEEARTAGANKFLRKQNSIIDLLNAVRRLLARPSTS